MQPPELLADPAAALGPGRRAGDLLARRVGEEHRLLPGDPRERPAVVGEVEVRHREARRRQEPQDLRLEEDVGVGLALAEPQEEPLAARPQVEVGVGGAPRLRPRALGRGEPEAPRRLGELFAGEIGVHGHRAAEHARGGRGASTRSGSRGDPLVPAGAPLASLARARAPVKSVRQEAGRPAPAKRKYDSAPVSRDKKDHIALSDAHNSRGIELADRGWLDEAIKEFLRAIELDPGSAHAHDNLATVYSEKRRFREALQEYLTALQLEPDSATAHYNLACFLASHGQDMAVAEYGEAIQLDPEYPDAHLNLGLAYADQGKAAEAVKELEVAIGLEPKDPFPRHELAALLMDEGDYRAAIAQLKEVVRLEPENFEAQLDLGICFAQKGFYAEAERAYRRARELQPEDLLLDYNVAALYALWGKKREALEALRRAVARDAGKVRGWLQSDPMFDGAQGDRPSSTSSRTAEPAETAAARRATSHQLHPQPSSDFTSRERSGSLRPCPSSSFYRHGEELLRVALGERTAVGRAAECDVSLPDPELSRVQAVIERRADGWHLSTAPARGTASPAPRSPRPRSPTAPRSRWAPGARVFRDRRRGEDGPAPAPPGPRRAPAASAAPTPARLRCGTAAASGPTRSRSAGVDVGKEPTCDVAHRRPVRLRAPPPHRAARRRAGCSSTSAPPTGPSSRARASSRAELPFGCRCTLGDAEIVLEPRDAPEPRARRGVRGDDDRATRRCGRSSSSSSGWARPTPR